MSCQKVYCPTIDGWVVHSIFVAINVFIKKMFFFIYKIVKKMLYFDKIVKKMLN